MQNYRLWRVVKLAAERNLNELSFWDKAFLIEDPETPLSVLEVLALDEEERIRARLLENDKVLESDSLLIRVLESIDLDKIDSQMEEKLYYKLEDPSVDPRVLDLLSQSNLIDFRLAIATHPNTAPHTLKRLIHDSEAVVISAASANHNLSKEDYLDYLDRFMGLDLYNSDELYNFYHLDPAKGVLNTRYQIPEPVLLRIFDLNSESAPYILKRQDSTPQVISKIIDNFRHMDGILLEDTINSLLDKPGLDSQLLLRAASEFKDNKRSLSYSAVMDILDKFLNNSNLDKPTHAVILSMFYDLGTSKIRPADLPEFQDILIKMISHPLTEAGDRKLFSEAYNNMQERLDLSLSQIKERASVLADADKTLPRIEYSKQVTKKIDSNIDTGLELLYVLLRYVKDNESPIYSLVDLAKEFPLFKKNIALLNKHLPGKFTREKLETVISKLSKDREGEDKFEQGFTDYYDSEQKFLGDRNNLVVQLNLKPEYMNRIFSKMGPDFKSWYYGISKALMKSGHPVLPVPGHTLGWMRVHKLEDDTWLINEIQEDWGVIKATAQNIASGTVNTYMDAEGRTHSLPEHVKKFFAKPEHYEWASYMADDILKDYEFMLMQAVMALARSSGVKHVYMLPDTIQTHIVGVGKRKKLYDALPKKFHFDKVQVDFHKKYKVNNDYEKPSYYWYRTAKNHLTI